MRIKKFENNANPALSITMKGVVRHTLHQGKHEANWNRNSIVQKAPGLEESRVCSSEPGDKSLLKFERLV